MIGMAAAFGLLLSGLVFGWAPMQQMLLNDGVYSYLCTHNNTGKRKKKKKKKKKKKRKEKKRKEKKKKKKIFTSFSQMSS